MQEERDDEGGKTRKVVCQTTKKEPRKKTVVGSREHGLGRSGGPFWSGASKESVT